MRARATPRPKRAARNTAGAATRARTLARLAPRDAWALGAGIERVRTRGTSDPQAVSLRLQITTAHTNFYGYCHGGVIFTLADSAFGLACNAAGEIAVALDVHVAFAKAARVGDVLTATARELTHSRRTALYRVEVRAADGTLVAHMLGTAYLPGRPISPLAELPPPAARKAASRSGPRKPARTRRTARHRSVEAD